MNHAATPSDSNHAAQQIAARRFGLALLASALAVATIAFAVYRASPPADSTLVKGARAQEAGIVVDNAATKLGELQYDNLIAAFTEALQREDDAALRAIYPTVSERELRVLHSLRRRLGASPLSASHLQLRAATPDHVTIGFEVVASRTHLPFEATIGRQHGAWLIEELR